MRLYIPLTDEAGDLLHSIASRETRDLRMQAKRLLEQAILAAATDEDWQYRRHWEDIRATPVDDAGEGE